ncbi:MAG: hypothetical protein ABSC05_08720 [Candidatus Solibacter sp.]|jgi:hypothetical protein
MLKLPAAGVLAGSARTATTSGDAALRDGTTAFEWVTLEMSLKQFRSMEEQSIRTVCAKVFRDWAALIRGTDGTAVMLWTEDGSEILEYRGHMADELDWGRYLGDSNPPKTPPGGRGRVVVGHSQSAASCAGAPERRLPEVMIWKRITRSLVANG